jgi:hypothetical protein
MGTVGREDENYHYSLVCQVLAERLARIQRAVSNAMRRGERLARQRKYTVDVQM